LNLDIDLLNKKTGEKSSAILYKKMKSFDSLPAVILMCGENEIGDVPAFQGTGFQQEVTESLTTAITII
jgi:hypothetical protein